MHQFFFLELAVKSKNYLHEAWQPIRNMCAQDLPSMLTICCRLALMDSEWMQQKVRGLNKFES